MEERGGTKKGMNGKEEMMQSYTRPRLARSKHSTRYLIDFCSNLRSISVMGRLFYLVEDINT